VGSAADVRLVGDSSVAPVGGLHGRGDGVDGGPHRRVGQAGGRSDVTIVALLHATPLSPPPLRVRPRQGKEVIARYTVAGWNTNGSWATDSNCREMQPRRRNYRPTWSYVVRGCARGPHACGVLCSPSRVRCGMSYPPSPSAADARARGGQLLPGHVRHHYGGCCHGGGVDGCHRSRAGRWFHQRWPAGADAAPPVSAEGPTSHSQPELTPHRSLRRLLVDDGRGVGEALNEPMWADSMVGLVVRGRHRIVVTPAAGAEQARVQAQQRALYPPFIATAPTSGSIARPTGSLLTGPLPINVHLPTVQPIAPGKWLVRIAHLYSATAPAPLNAPATVNLGTLFAGVTVTDVTEMTIVGSQPLATAPTWTYNVAGRAAPLTLPIVPAAPSGPTWSVTVTPMQIRAFEVSVQ